MTKHALNFDDTAFFKQICTHKLFITFKMSSSCCFSLGENLDFPDFLQKKFYNINCRYSDLNVILDEDVLCSHVSR